MNPQLISLIAQLNTNSEKDRYNVLLEFLLSHPDLFTPEEKEALVASYRSARDKKVAQGKQDAERRWAKRQQPSTQTQPRKQRHDDKWIFIKSSPYGSCCRVCNRRYEIGETIFCRNSKGYHIECAAPEAKENIHYREWLSPTAPS